MKKLYLFLLALVLCTVGASAQGLDATFTTAGQWPAGWSGTTSNATYTIANGNLNITMGTRADGVYVGAFKWAGSLAVSSTANQFLAVKFIGQVPANNVSVAITTTDGQNVQYYRNTNQTLTTNEGNTVYYYQLGTSAPAANTTPITLPCTFSTITTTTSSPKNSTVTSCVVDWIKTFATLDDLKNSINVGDDDPNDDDDAHADPVVKIGTTNYYSLNEAWNAATTGQTLTLQKNVFVDARLTTNGRNITIDGNGNKLINRVAAYTGIMFQTTGTPAGSLTLKNLTIDGGNIIGQNQLIDVYNGGTVTLMDVTFTNCVNTNSNTANLGIINARNGNLNLTNVTIDSSCTVAEGYGQVNAASNGVVLRGTTKFSLYLDGSAYATNNGMSAGSAVTLEFDDNRNLDATLVKSVDETSAAYFTLPSDEKYADYKLVVKDGNLFAVDTTKEYTNYPVYITNAEGEAISGFTTFAGAWNAVTTGETIVINETATGLVVDAALNANGRTFTINGNNATISRGAKFVGTMFATAGTGTAGTVTFNNLTIDGANIATASQVMSIVNGGTFNLNNVKVQNATTTDSFGLIAVRSNSTLNADGLTFTGCTAPTGELTVYTNNVNLKGVCSFSLFAATEFHATNAGLAEGTAISLVIDPATRMTSKSVLNNVAVTGEEGSYALANSYYTCGVENYKLYIKDVTDGEGNIYIVDQDYVDPTEAVVYVEGNEENGFLTFADAWTYALANNNTTLVLKANVTVSARLTGNANNITVKSQEGNTYTIARENGYKDALIQTAAGTITFEGVNFDGKAVSGAHVMFTIPQGTLALNNVTISNAVETSLLGVINVSGGTLNASNLTIDATSTVPAGMGQIYVNTNNANFSGVCNFSVFVDGANHINNAGLESGSAINVMFYTNNASNNRNLEASIVNNVDETSQAYFTCGVEGEELELTDGNLFVHVEKVIVAMIGETEYETLAAAWNAAVSGDVITIIAEATVTEPLRTNGRSLTVTSGTAATQNKAKAKVGEEATTQTISRAASYNNNFLFAASSGDLTLDNVNLNDNNITTSQPMVVANGSATLNLDNVKVENSRSTSATGLVAVQSNATLNANNLTATAADNNDNSKVVYAENSNVNLSGDTNANVYLAGTDNSINGKDVSSNSNVAVSFDATTRDTTAPVVTGITEDNKDSFSTADSNYGLYTPNIEDGSLYYTDDHNVSGVESVIEDVNEIVDVYNLQGVKVRSAVRAGEAATELPAGLYIFGGKKVLVK